MSKQTAIKQVEDIANLPWCGNHFGDAGLFRAVETFVRRQRDPEIQKRAIYLMGLHGMGFDQQVTNAQLEGYLDDLTG